MCTRFPFLPGFTFALRYVSFERDQCRLGLSLGLDCDFPWAGWITGKNLPLWMQTSRYLASNPYVKHLLVKVAAPKSVGGGNGNHGKPHKGSSSEVCRRFAINQCK